MIDFSVVLTASIVSPEDAGTIFLRYVDISLGGGSIFLRNVGIYLQVHTALQPRRPTSTFSPP
jgi:hypothetical protein